MTIRQLYRIDESDEHYPNIVKVVGDEVKGWSLAEIKRDLDDRAAGWIEHWQLVRKAARNATHKKLKNRGIYD